jgi:hypothetical protein
MDSLPAESLPKSGVSPTRQTQRRPNRGKRGIRGLRLASTLPAGTMNHIFAGSMHKSKTGWVCYSYQANASDTKGPAYYRERAASDANGGTP